MVLESQDSKLVYTGGHFNITTVYGLDKVIQLKYFHNFLGEISYCVVRTGLILKFPVLWLPSWYVMSSLKKLTVKILEQLRKMLGDH